MFNHLIDDFCNSFNPIDYFQLQSTFTFSDLPIATTSFAANPAIDVLADDLLSSQQCSRGSHRYYFSSSDNGPPIVVDSGASFLVTPLFSDFITGKYTTASRSCESLTGTTKILGHGPIHWRFLDFNENSQDLYPQVQYIPDAGIRLFRPQQYFVACQGGSLFFDKDGCNLTLTNGNSFGIPYNCRNNLHMLSPLSFSSSVSGYTKSLLSFQDLSSSTLTLLLTDETNQNMTSPLKELLVWHWLIGHLGFG